MFVGIVVSGKMRFAFDVLMWCQAQSLCQLKPWTKVGSPGLQKLQATLTDPVSPCSSPRMVCTTASPQKVSNASTFARPGRGSRHQLGLAGNGLGRKSDTLSIWIICLKTVKTVQLIKKLLMISHICSNNQETIYAVSELSMHPKVHSWASLVIMCLDSWFLVSSLFHFPKHRSWFMPGRDGRIWQVIGLQPPASKRHQLRDKQPTSSWEPPMAVTTWEATEAATAKGEAAEVIAQVWVQSPKWCFYRTITNMNKLRNSDGMENCLHSSEGSSTLENYEHWLVHCPISYPLGWMLQM